MPLPKLLIYKYFALSFLLVCIMCIEASAQKKSGSKPNVIIIYADDLGYGDLGSYGATKIRTPHLDRLAREGIRFTNAHASSATCTPSRYALITGQYPWRRQGTGVLPGDASLIIPTNTTTLPKIFKQAGYNTAVIGKWHLGLGTTVDKNWNDTIRPGPNEVGFDEAFIFPATADRVPTVFLRNGLVVGLDSTDPIEVNYTTKIGSEPTGSDNPELLKMKAMPNHGHNNTIINGIGRIGYMKGGRMARWTDEEVPLTFLDKSKAFIEKNHHQPFFLYYSLTEPHVPRMPSTVFKGSSGLGYRGDAILQLDWTVGEILKLLDYLKIADKTLVIFTSDNGPVLDDGYDDGAVTQLNGHTPWGPLRGGKYSAFEGGTRVPFIVRWPQKVKQGISHSLISQVDLLASFAALLQQPFDPIAATDSENQLPALLDAAKKGRSNVVIQGGTLAVIEHEWKYIVPHNGPSLNKLVNIETANAPVHQLYNLKTDLGEKRNLAEQHPEKVKAMENLLQQIKMKKLQ